MKGRLLPRIMAIILALVMTFVPMACQAAEASEPEQGQTIEAPAAEEVAEDAEEAEEAAVPAEEPAEPADTGEALCPEEPEAAAAPAATKAKSKIRKADWSLNQSSMTISSSTEYFYVTVYGAEVDYVTSSNENVAVVDDWYTNEDNSTDVALMRKGGGKTTITVWATDGTSRTCKVTSKYAPFKLSQKKLVFGKKIYYDAYSIWMKNGDPNAKFKKAVSSKKKVATAKVEYGGVTITAKKAGKTTVTVTDNAGRKAKIAVVVKKNWRKANLEWNSWGSVQYENTKPVFYGKRGTKVTLKIGGKKYTKKIGKKGMVKIKIKKHYKLKTKYTVTYRYKGAKFVDKRKVNSFTSVSLGTLWTCRNEVPITVYSALKGDKVYVTVNGKTYKQKITYSGTFSTTIYTDSNLGYVSTVGVKVKNRYKQTTYKDTKTIYWN